MWRLLKSPPSVMREPTILASALTAAPVAPPWSAQHAEATALRHRLEILARHLEMGEGEAVDHAWVQRFVASHTRLVELGCRLEEGFVDVDSEAVMGDGSGAAQEAANLRAIQMFHWYWSVMHRCFSCHFYMKQISSYH
ncbi:unnamed protein product [Cladocopium goreaui]|uniref:HTH CENPB-type domain-containing protein n=1 Tax=Cladocopium goreaui TaxID=2562237 RepID=A0A9P1BJ82_9DINO|nr:unnamed protein product [Cladocopium goreaui]